MDAIMDTHITEPHQKSELEISFRKLKNISPTGTFITTKVDIPLKLGLHFTDIREILKTPWVDVYKKHFLEDKQDLFFTLGLGPADDQTTRTWLAQKVLLFDCDGADFKRKQAYIDSFTEVTGLPPSYYSLTWTGGGFHFLVALKTPIESKEFFTENKVAYQFILEKLLAKCKQKGIPGSWDPNVFAPNFMSRLPGSLNSKYEGEKGRVILIQDSLIDVEFDLSKVSGLPKISKEDMISKKELAYFKIDTATALTGCDFLRYSKEHARSLTEPEWFATLSILSRFENGRNLAHEYSKPHPSYSETGTNQKLDYIQKSGMGPRTCGSIESMFPGCRDCKYYKKVRSPVQIKGDRFIATRESGFSLRTEKGATQYQHKDLLLHFEEENPFVYVPEMKSIYTWNGVSWGLMVDAQVKEYAQNRFKPFVERSNVVNEFWNLLSRTNVTPYASFFDAPNLIGKINLQNGILDVETGELLAHSKGYGFQTVLPINYIPDAPAPMFRKMISDVTCGDTQLENVLQEWFGYTMSGCLPHSEKMLICVGEGQNGKSKTLQILRALVGDRFYAASFANLGKQFTLINFLNKDFVLFEEVPKAGEKQNWETLKNLSSGGEISDSFKGKDHLTFRPRAKIAMTCNVLPQGTDPTHGYFRKLLIIPFNATFSAEQGNMDPQIAEKIIDAELPGVLNWALDGYKRLKNQSWQFSNANASKEALSDLKQDTDHIGTFLSEWLEAGEQEAGVQDLSCEHRGLTWVDVDELYDRFKKEYEPIVGKYMPNSITFKKRLKIKVQKMLGGIGWVKVEGAFREYSLLGATVTFERQILATLSTRRNAGEIRTLIRGVRISVEAGGPGF